MYNIYIYIYSVSNPWDTRTNLTAHGLVARSPWLARDSVIIIIIIVIVTVIVVRCLVIVMRRSG